MHRVDEAAAEVFARHETFHPRYGWFRKAVRAAAKSPDVFTREDAPVELGVGKNMVRAIRFWGKAAKVLTDAQNPERPRLASSVPSRNGAALLGEHPGLDPYLELPGSLWLLHWWMLAKTCSLPVWWITFNQFGPVEFSEEDLLGAVLDELRRVPAWSLPVEASIKKDVDCLLRMYAPRVAGQVALDDLLDCPFRELGLLESVWDDAHRYRFVIGDKLTLPPEIVSYACLEYLAVADPGARTSTISRLALSAGGPGRVFKLTEEALATALNQYARRQTGVRLTSAAGVLQLAVDGDLRQQAVEALRAYYRQAGHRVEGPLVLGEHAATHDLESIPRGSRG
jgi:hypothetical protein